MLRTTPQALPTTDSRRLFMIQHRMRPSLDPPIASQTIEDMLSLALTGLPRHGHILLRQAACPVLCVSSSIAMPASARA